MNDTPLPADLMGLILSSLFYFLVFLVSTYIAKIKGFFSLPFKNFCGVFASGVDVAACIAFFVFSFLFGGMLSAMLDFSDDLSPVLVLSLAQSLSLAISITLITLYALIKKTFHPLYLIKDYRFPGNKSLTSDILSGLKTFLLSIFPLFTLMCLFEILVILKGGKPPAMQDAVAFLIRAAKDNNAIYPAIFAIVIAAPCIEEFLFRGVIQSFLRKKYGSKLAIIIASIVFSLFHFSTGQGFQNIFILPSLFILSLYLGFIYEKTHSLIASITLHVTFNLVNTIVIILHNV